MSVYSGFATRHLEENYNKSLYHMSCLISIRLLKLFKGGTLPHHNPSEHFDPMKFKYYFSKLYGKLMKLDNQKHLAPRFSYCFKDLALYLDLKEEDMEKVSSASSISLVLFNYW